MSNSLFFYLFVVVGLRLEGGKADLKCPIPPFSAQLYFDLEQIALTAMNDPTEFINSPQLCRSENDPICDSQPCCFGEVGCCYTNPKTGVKKCGCKNQMEETCSHPAPLAVIGGEACEAHKHAKISLCFTESRGALVGPYTLTKNSSIDILKSTRNDKLTLGVKTPAGDVNGDADLTANGDAALDDLTAARRFSGRQLVDKLYKRTLDEIVDTVNELRKKELPYGHDE